MVDEHRSTEVLIDELDDDDASHQTTAELDYPPPIPCFGPPASPARALRRRCVRRNHKRRKSRSRHRRGSSTILPLILLITGSMLCLQIFGHLG